MTKGLCYEFDLRSDFKVQLILPYDLSRAEADRLITLLNSLPQPQIAGPLEPTMQVRAVEE